MARVGIVCDSTCDLGLEWFKDNDVRMVPLRVMFGKETSLDWEEMSPELFFPKLTSSPALPTTSQPSPADFTKAYQELADAGFDEIVSVHLTSPLSGTFESATMAKEGSPIPVRVVDTKRVSHATGLAVKAAVEARDAGKSAEEIERIAIDVAASTNFYFVLDTLEYLVKGGRAGKASGLLGSVLNIKPILTFNQEGTIEPFKKVKGLKKAMAEVAVAAAEDSREYPIRLIVFHSTAPHLAEEILTLFDDAGVRYELDSVGLVGSVIGTYTGPNAIGCAYYPLR